MEIEYRIWKRKDEDGKESTEDGRERIEYGELRMNMEKRV